MKGIISKFAILKVDFFIEPSDTLLVSVHVYTFQPGNCTGWGSEEVKTKVEICMHELLRLSDVIIMYACNFVDFAVLWTFCISFGVASYCFFYVF